MKKSVLRRPILVVARSFPPSVQSAGSVVLYRLFHNIDPEDYIVVSGDERPIDKTRILPISTIKVDIFPRKYRFSRFSFLFIPMVFFTTLVFALKNRPKHVFATYPFNFFIIAAYFVAKVMQLPFSIYFHDVWEEAETNLIQGKLAKFFEPLLVHQANNIFVISEALQEHFFQKYKIETTLLRHPMPIAEFSSKSLIKEKPKTAYHVVYTGNIYWLNKDVIKNLINAVQLITDISIQIDFYTSQSQEEVMGILELQSLQKISIQWVAFEEIPLVQSQADILFVGVTFEKSSKVAADTTFPTKFVEYLFSGKPILVNAPPSSFLARFVKEHECALFVDDLDPKNLQEAIQRLCVDANLVKKIVAASISQSSLYDDIKQSEILATKLGIRLNDNNRKTSLPDNV